jgi:hypothetical protein
MVLRTAAPTSVWPWILVAIVSAFAAFSDQQTMLVTLPLATALIGATVFFWALWWRTGGSIPWFEIGAIYTTVVTLYLAYPVIGFLALAGTYTPLSDVRFLILPPDPGEVGRIGWLYVSHLLGFALAYLLFRGRLPRIQPRPQPPGISTVAALLIVFLLIQGFDVAVWIAYPTFAGSYTESYLAAQRLPLLLAQLQNHLDGMKYPLAIALLAVLFADYRTGRPIILIWLLAVAGSSVVHLGSRTEVVLLLMSAVAMYHTLVRPLSGRFIVISALVGLVGFVAFGVLRAGGNRVEGYSILNPFTAATEFDILFANAVDLSRLSKTVSVPTALYFADLPRLVPQQVLPFTKIDPAAWYVTTFFPDYAASGGGLAFGTISEAVLTGGWFSALARGAALGLCFAAIHRAYLRRSRSFWGFVFYIWLSTLAYQSFRNTTFSLGVLFLYRFVPTVVFVAVIASGLSIAADVFSRFASSPLADTSS